MAGAGAYPKPESQRQRTNATTFEWVRFPESGNKTIPPMPRPPVGGDNWHVRAAEWWLRHWSHPCAMGWRPDDPCHERLLTLEQAVLDDGRPHQATTLTEIRQLEDRLGLTPKARLQLRWMIVPDGQASVGHVEPVGLASVSPLAERKRIDPRKP